MRVIVEKVDVAASLITHERPRFQHDQARTGVICEQLFQNRGIVILVLNIETPITEPTVVVEPFDDKLGFTTGHGNSCV